MEIIDQESSGIAVPGAIWLAVSIIGPLLPWSDYAVSAVAVVIGYWPAVALWAAIPLVAIWVAAKRIVQHRYWAAAGCLLLPGAAIVLWFFSHDTSSIVSFRLNKQAYDAIVADAEAGRCSADDHRRWQAHVEIYAANCQAAVIVIFFWGGFLSVWHGVVYDATDQIILEPSKRSAAWQATKTGELLGCSGTDHPLGDHYYLASGDFVGTGGGPCE